jgi:hypothetical protein
MSGGENAKFMALKSAYLDTTLILWRESQVLNGKGIYEFDLQRISTTVVDTGGAQVTGCELIPAAARKKATSAASKLIKAYYLPFQPDQAFHHRLTDDVDYCFTPTLNGCTFVVGAGATPLISHYNYVDDPKADNPTIDQAKIDARIGQRYPTGASTIKRADYKVGPALDYRVTVVGFRENGAWHFHYQRRAQDLTYVKGKGSSLVTIAANMRVQLT